MPHDHFLHSNEHKISFHPPGATGSSDAPRAKKDQDRRARQGPYEQQSASPKSPRHASQIPERRAKGSVLLEALLGPSGVTFLVDGTEVSHVPGREVLRVTVSVRVIQCRFIQF